MIGAAEYVVVENFFTLVAYLLPGEDFLCYPDMGFKCDILWVYCLTHSLNCLNVEIRIFMLNKSGDGMESVLILVYTKSV